MEKKNFMKKVFLTFYLFLLCLVSGQSIDSILTYSQHFDLALDHFSKGRYQLAENEFKNILIEKRNFDDPVSHFMLAKTQFKQNKEIACERTCNSYINKYPDSRYEVNVRYKNEFERKGLIFSAMSPDGTLPEIIELKNHPWFIGVQFHPEFKSRPFTPHPLFSSFIKAAGKRKGTN